MAYSYKTFKTPNTYIRPQAEINYYLYSVGMQLNAKKWRAPYSIMRLNYFLTIMASEAHAYQLIKYIYFLSTFTRSKQTRHQQQMKCH